MRRTTLAATAATSLVLVALMVPAAQASAPNELATHGRSSQPITSVDGAPVEAPSRGVSQQHAAKPARPGTSPNMTYHGGKILKTADITPIFWGTSWGTYTGDKMTGIDSFWAGWNNSHYAGTSAEYTDSTGSHVGVVTTSHPSVVDTSAASGGSNSTTILNEVARMVTAGKVLLKSDGTSVVPVYTDLPRGSAGYCAWHASGTIGGTAVQFHFYWKLDGDAGCDPGDTSNTHSQGLAAIANVSGHEMAETITDPNTSGAPNTAGWYDSKGAENGDKCAWTFGAPLISFSNGTQWKVQGEWSNAAYTAGTGYANSSGQRGCLGGQ